MSKSGLIGLLCIYNTLLCQISLGQNFNSSYKTNTNIVFADSLLKSHNYDAAINAFLRFASQYKEEKNYEAYIYCLNQIGRSYVDLEFYYYFDNTLKFEGVATQAVKEGLKFLSPTHPELGYAFANLGFYHWNKKDRDADSSLIAFKKAIEIIESSVEQPIYSAYAYRGLGNVYYRRDKYSLALRGYQRSVIELETTGEENPMELAKSYYGLGIAERGAGETIGARLNYSKAIDILTNYPDNPIKKLFINRIRNSFANTYVDEKEYATSQNLYIDIIQSEENKNSPTLIRPYANIAVAYAADGKFDLALKNIHKSLAIEPKGRGRNEARLADNYIQCSYIHYLIGNADSVFYYAKKTEEIYTRIYGEYATATCQEQYALGYKLKSDYTNALKSIQKTIVLSDPNFDNLDINSNPKIDSTRNYDRLYGFLAIKANLFYELYKQSNNRADLLASYKIYQTLDSLTDEIRRGIYSQSTKLIINNFLRKEAENALRCIYTLAKNSNDPQYLQLAYKFFEKNRYSGMYENVSAAQAISKANLPDSLYDVERALQFEYNVHKQLLASVTGKQSDSIRSLMLNVYRKNNELQEYLRLNYPSYFSSKYGEIIPLDSIQKYLDPNTQFIGYLTGDSTLMVLSITRDKSLLEIIPILENLTQKINAYLKQISNQIDLVTPVDQIYKQYSEVSFKLYEQLVKPVILPSISRLIFSPDGSLTKLPFETLVSNNESLGFKYANYLLKQFDIQYVYSLNVLNMSQKSYEKRSPSLLAFSYSNISSDIASTRSQSNEIPASAKEILAISRIFKGKNNRFLIGDNATETSFKALASGYEVIHLAVHGVGDTTKAINSRLEFRDINDGENDGKLYAHELYNLDLNSLRLAVLSACETGIGKNLPGEGVFSIARGFAYAGCPSMIMSLWQVSDVYTASLMEYFYHNLEEGLEVDKSLRNAKLSFLENADEREAFPYYWSGFITQGDVTPITEPGFSKMSLLYIILPLILIASFFVIRRSSQ